MISVIDICAEWLCEDGVNKTTDRRDECECDEVNPFLHLPFLKTSIVLFHIYYRL